MGAVLRYQLGNAIAKIVGPEAGFPWGTLTVNVTGSLAMGLLFGWLAGQTGPNEGWRMLLGVGLLGGFTTFSAFSLEIMQLIERGSMGLAIFYGGTSVLAGVAALFVGVMIMRSAA